MPELPNLIFETKEFGKLLKALSISKSNFSQKFGSWDQRFGKHLEALSISKFDFLQNFGFWGQRFGKHLKALSMFKFDFSPNLAFENKVLENTWKIHEFLNLIVGKNFRAKMHKKSHLLEGHKSEVLGILFRKNRKMWLSSPRIVLLQKFRKFVVSPKVAQYDHPWFKIPP